jgi:ADP-ribose pyrophosphatase YjhB (NUDIX family)
MESEWLTMAKRLHSVAETGIAYATDPYDVERYQEIAEIALKQLAALGQQPIERVKSLVSEGAKGYVTPKVDVRGAVFQENRILLVREKSDNLWTMPGGFADVGLSPAENVEKEILEEAGIVIEASYLYSVRHKARGEYDPDVRDFYKLFFLCEGNQGDIPVPGDETSDADYFDVNQLPPLSTGRTVESDIHAACKFHSNRGRATHFD